MSEPAAERRGAGGRLPDGVDRRQRRQDPWRKVLNWLAYVVYPLLIFNVFLFMAVASEDQKGAMAARMEEKRVESSTVQIPQTASGHTAAQGVSEWVHLNAFLPVMVAGVGIGIIGIVLDRKRSRRRSDYSLMTPLVLVILSVAGLFVYFIVRAVMV